MPSPIEPKPSLKARFEALLEEYGTVAIVIYFASFVLVFAGSAIAISMGVHFESAAGTAGTLAMAYAVTVVTKPFRIGGTVLLTPIIGKLVRKFRPKQPPKSGDAAS